MQLLLWALVTGKQQATYLTVFSRSVFSTSDLWEQEFEL